MKHLKLYENFRLNEEFSSDTASLIAVIIQTGLLAGVATGLSIAAIKTAISNFIHNRKVNKIYNNLMKYLKDPVIKPLIVEYSSLCVVGEKEVGDRKQDYYSYERLKELSLTINNRLKELMTPKEYDELEKFRTYIKSKLKTKYSEEEPEEYFKPRNYVPEWDKDTIVDVFLRNASNWFDYEMKAINWRRHARDIIEKSWIIKNDNIILEAEEEEGDDDVIYGDNEIINEFVRDLTEEWFEEGAWARNFRRYLTDMIIEKGYEISKK